MSGSHDPTRHARVLDMAHGIALGRVAHLLHKQDAALVLPTEGDIALAEQHTPPADWPRVTFALCGHVWTIERRSLEWHGYVDGGFIRRSLTLNDLLPGGVPDDVAVRCYALRPDLHTATEGTCAPI